MEHSRQTTILDQISHAIAYQVTREMKCTFDTCLSDILCNSTFLFLVGGDKDEMADSGKNIAIATSELDVINMMHQQGGLV